MLLPKTLNPLSYIAMYEGDDNAVADVANPDVLSGFAEEESETSEESSTEKTDGEAKSGEDGKTQEPSDEQVEKDLLTKGDSIPFERFKQFIDKRNTKFSDFKEQLEDMKAEFEEAQALQNDPNVYRAILQKQGITDPKILNDKMVEKGFKVEEEVPKSELAKQLSQGLDLTKTEGWVDLVMRAVEYGSKKHLTPIAQRLDSRDSIDRLIAQEPEARKMSELFGIDYGNEKKDGENLETGVGKMMKYLKDNPDKMSLVQSGQLTKAEALKLALAEKGITLGKQKGNEEEQNRNKDLKASQMEDSTQTAPSDEPSADAPYSEIADWAAKHPDRI